MFPDNISSTNVSNKKVCNKEEAPERLMHVLKKQLTHALKITETP